MPKDLLSIGDLSSEDIDWIRDRALRDADPGGTADRARSAAMVFLAPSLRTRASFEVAATRRGFSVLNVSEPRYQEGMSAAESFEDTVHTLSGFVDLIVLRCNAEIDEAWVEANCDAPLINAGSGGSTAEHPTQALVDFVAIEHEAGPLAEQTIAISGDLRHRAVRSMLALLSIVPPKRLILIAPTDRADHGVRLDAELDRRTEWREPGEFDDVTVLYLPGLPPGVGDGRLDDQERARFAFTTASSERLPDAAVVLSPMPVIDEIAPELRADPRVRLWGPSSRAPAVRGAVIELVMDGR